MSKIFNDVIYVQRGSFMDMIVKDCIGNKDWTHPPRKYVLESEVLKEIEKLKQENEKLKKGLGFYAKFESYNVHRNKGLTQEIRVLPMSDCDKFNDCGYKLILGGKLARITLKEIEESK